MLTSYLSIYGLLALPIQAQQQQQSGGDPGHWANVAIGVTQNIFGAIIQQRQQAIQQAQQLQMLNSMAPQTTQARFFPNCMVPASGSVTPGNICKAQDPGSYNLYQSFVQLADGYEQHYSQMLSKAQHSNTPVGLQCVDTKRKEMMSSMQRRQNSLQTLITRLRKEEQAFRDRNKERLAMMERTYGELHGSDQVRGEEPESNDAKTRDYANYYSQDCQNVIGRDALNSGSQVGLVGLHKSLEGKNQSAGNFRKDQASMKQEFNRTVQKIMSDLNNKGIEDVFNSANQGDPNAFLNKYQTGNQNIAVINTVMIEKATELAGTRNRVQNDLNNLLGEGAFQIPSMGRNFSQDFGRFINNADEFFRKKHVNECVTLADAGVGLSIDQVIQSVEHRPTNNGGNAHILYRQALQNILNSDAFIEDKLLQIRQLDLQYRNEITVNYRGPEATPVNETPYTIIQKIVAQCERSYYQDNTYQPGRTTASGASKNIDIERAKNLMNELKSDFDNFTSDLEKDITDRVLNCRGNSLPNNACSSADVFSTSNERFCFPHAETCSQQVMACHQEAGQIVEQKKGQIKAQADIFNREAEALVATQEGILQQIVQQVLADAEFLSQYFPGADFVYPSELFVEMPEMALRHGEKLRGGGEISFDDLINKVESLRQQLAAQADKIDREINEYMVEVERAIQENRQKWAGIKSACEGASQAIAKSIADSQAQQAQAQSQADDEVGKFCRQYNRIAGASNPMAGCGGANSPEKMYDDIHRIASRLDPQVVRNVERYANLCQQYNNQRDEGTSSTPTRRVPDLDIASVCRESRDADDANNQVVRNIQRRLPSALQRHRDAIARYLRGEIERGELPEQVRADEYFVDDLTSWRARIGHSESITGLAGHATEETIKGLMPGDALPSSGVCLAYASQIFSSTLTTADVTTRSREVSRSYDQNIRAIASVDPGNAANDDLTRQWNNIGENAADNCIARAGGNRNNPFGGGLPLPGGGSLPLPSGLMNFGQGL